MQLRILLLANLSYDQTATDLLTVEVSNGGGISAWGAGLAYYLTTETSGECSNLMLKQCLKFHF